MGVFSGAREYLADRTSRTGVHPEGLSYDMTTDHEEGRRQIEAMQPPVLKVGDKVRLRAGGERVMEVVELKDYDNKVWCCWLESATSPDLVRNGATTEIKRETFPVRSLVRLEP